MKSGANKLIMLSCIMAASTQLDASKFSDVIIAKSALRPSSVSKHVNATKGIKHSKAKSLANRRKAKRKIH